MHPAFSVIFFTVVSGIGYGLLFVLAVVLLLNPITFARDATLTLLVLGAVLVSAGLIASTLHLGQPQRAWRAFSQWRSSWLSREGVAAMCTFAPIVGLGVCAAQNGEATVLRAWAVLLAALAAVTVACTAKIYTSLKTIPAWHDALVLPGYLCLGLLNGAVWCWAVGMLLRAPIGGTASRLVLLLLAAGASALKLAYWRRIRSAAPVATAESATGLGRFGVVRSVEAPHTEANYLTREMGFVLARKHAWRLGRVALALLGPVPAVLIVASLLVPSAGFVAVCAVAAAACITAGTFVERWLFFAEAKHVVMLYYGGRSEPA
jgi:DMSO reductase anchor subunit